MNKKLIAFVCWLATTGAQAQPVQQTGTVTPGHAAAWTTNGVIRDGGTAANGNLTSLGVRASGTGICQNSDFVTAAGYQQLCLGVTTAGGATISLQNFGSAPALGLSFSINGNIVTLPSAAGTIPILVPHIIQTDPLCASTTPGAIVGCGFYNLTAGQLWVAQTNGTEPIWRTLSGDSTILNTGVTTVTRVNGVSYPISPSTNTVPVVTGSNTITYEVVPVAAGGTNANTAAGARTNLGLGTMATQDATAVAITGGTITGMPTPTSNTDVANKSYVDGLASGLHILSPVRLATAAVMPNTPTYSNGASGVGATLTAGSNGALSVDGTLTVSSNRILIKDQAAPAQNGIYTVTTVGDGSNPYVVTRATDFDTSAEMLAGSYVTVTAGSTNIGSSYALATTVVTVGSSAVNFNQFSSANTGVLSLGGLTGVVTLGTGLTTSGNSILTTGLAPLASPTFTGTPAAPTASCGTSTTQLATTAFVAGQFNCYSAQTTTYTVLSTDCNSTIGLGGTAFYSVTINAASGYTDGCLLTLTNRDNNPSTWQAKRINVALPDGSSTRLLSPGQSITYQKSGATNEWQIKINPGRWQPIVSPTFYVNPSGSSTNDCLQPATACNTIYGVISTWKPLLDCGGQGPLIQLANNQTYVVSGGSQEAYAWVGGCALTIQGATSINDRSTYIVQCPDGGACFNFREPQTVVILNGMTINCPTNNCTGVNVTQGPVTDINNIAFNSNTGGTHISCDEHAMCNIFFSIINGSAAVYLACSNASYCLLTGATQFPTSAISFAVTMEATNFGTILANGSTSITNGLAVTGQKCAVDIYGIINLLPIPSTAIPGNSNCTATNGGLFFN